MPPSSFLSSPHVTWDAMQWQQAHDQWLAEAKESTLPAAVLKALSEWFLIEQNTHQTTPEKLKEHVQAQIETVMVNYGASWSNTDSRVRLNLKADLAEKSVEGLLNLQQESLTALNETLSLLKAALVAVRPSESASVDPLMGYFYDGENGLLFWLFTSTLETHQAVAKAWCATGWFSKESMESLWAESLDYIPPITPMNLKKRSLGRLSTFKNLRFTAHVMPPSLLSAIENGGLKFQTKVTAQPETPLTAL
jgi:hypothetical protein